MKSRLDLFKTVGPWAGFLIALAYPMMILGGPTPHAQTRAQYAGMAGAPEAGAAAGGGAWEQWISAEWIDAANLSFYRACSREDTSAANDGDGRIDPNESALMKVTLSNTGDASTTTVWADVLTSTLGVTLTTSRRAFPDIPPGGTGISNADYKFSLARCVACTIDFELQMHADQGSWTNLFTQEVSEDPPAYCVGSATSAAVVDLFEVTGPAVAPSAKSTARAYPIRMNLDPVLRDGVASVALPLPDGRRLEATTEGVEPAGEGDIVWTGRIRGRHDSIVLTIGNGRVTGILPVDDGYYVIESPARNQQVMTKVDFEPGPIDPDLGGSRPGVVPPDPDVPPEDPDTVSYIDTLALYTSAAEASTSSITQTIKTRINQVNTAFANSNVNARLRRVATVKWADYVESGYAKKDLNRLILSSFQVSQRQTYSADVVLLFVSNFSKQSTVCGGAYQMSVYPPTLDDATKHAFAVVKVASCTSTPYDLGHEIGHVLGCGNEVGSTDGVFPYSHGYQHPNAVSRKSWSTLMARPTCTPACPHVLRYSNPSCCQEGDYSGVTDEADCALTFNTTAPDVANYSTLIGP